MRKYLEKLDSYRTNLLTKSLKTFTLHMTDPHVRSEGLMVIAINEGPQWKMFLLHVCDRVLCY